jgi:hypothetical protein
MAIRQDHEQHQNEDPADRYADRDFGKDIAGLGAKRAGAADAAEGAGEAASFAALDQDDADHEE